MTDFTICIAHRGDPMGLWATIESCEIDLAGSKYDYNYSIVMNGSGKLGPVDERTRDFLQKAGKLKAFEHNVEPMSPPSARQRTAELADGKLLFFFDNHCLVNRDYFTRAIINFEQHDMDMLHSATIFHTGDMTHYHYKLRLNFNFWAASVFIPEYAYKPYKLAMAGHGGFVVKKKVWDEVGGYWTGFTGYGGEETYFDLKMAMLDKTNWIDPQMIHTHYAGMRGYSRHYSTDFYRNMMMCANIIGGTKWMYAVYENFRKWIQFKSSTMPMFDLMVQAEERSREHAAYFASIRKRTLDEQLKFFTSNLIAYK